jgi:hypothetical protein
MYDIIIDSDFKPKRDVVIHHKVNFRFEGGINSIVPEEGAVRILVNGNNYTHTYLTGGKKKVSIRSNGDHDFEITVKSPQSGLVYTSPDTTWNIQTSENFIPKDSCESAAYLLSERPQKGFASAYIKYGAGHNGRLVRPIIFVDGIDFGTSEVFTDPNLGNAIIRHGSTGWDVLTLGMEDSELDEPENGVLDYEAFGAYPAAFQSLLSQNAQNMSIQ